jgi:cellulase/cellobiase CelA1
MAGNRMWSMGHRNVQGLAWDGAGRLWASEFGQNTWDELNLIQAGRNYGWPTAEGRAGNPNFVDPVTQWSTAEASPSGIAFASNTVWLASLRGTRLWGVPVANGALDGSPVAFLNGTLGRLRLVTVAPDGSLWLVTNNTDGRGTPRTGDDRIVRLTLGGTPPPPPPPGGCTVRDDMNAWNTGFTSNFTITNNSPTPINGWSLVFTLPAGQVITSTWNATYTPTSGQVTARNVSFNGTIPANGGQVTGFGFQANHTGNTSKPTSFTLNGTACTIG